MKKITNSLILASMITISTGCVSDTLALVLPQNNDTQTLALADTGEEQTRTQKASEKGTTKMDETIAKTGEKIDSKLDIFIDKLFDKL